MIEMSGIRPSTEPEVFLPELRTMLDDPNSGVRDAAADMLGTIGRPAIGLAIELVQTLLKAIAEIEHAE